MAARQSANQRRRSPCAAALCCLAAATLVCCDEFPPGCNDALEDFLDDQELWDNAFDYGMKGMFDEARKCFEVYVASQPARERGWKRNPDPFFPIDLTHAGIAVPDKNPLAASSFLGCAECRRTL